MHQFTNTYCLLAAGFLRIVDGQKLEQAIDERSQEGDCDCNVCAGLLTWSSVWVHLMFVDSYCHCKLRALGDWQL